MYHMMMYTYNNSMKLGVCLPDLKSPHSPVAERRERERRGERGKLESVPISSHVDS